LAKTWNLPEDLVEAISYHHAPSQAQNYVDLANVIHVANGLASLLGIGGGVDSFLNPLQQEALDRLSLKESDLELLMADLGEFLVDPYLFQLGHDGSCPYFGINLLFANHTKLG
jgi:HD-like signal output (HDOD) protein